MLAVLQAKSLLIASVATIHVALALLRLRRGRPHRCFNFVIAGSLLLLAAPDAAAGQLGALVAPGPLSKAHAAPEGGVNCAQCHEATRTVTARRCLACHKPIEDRIARKSGVHRKVAGDCLPCHTEHGGADAQIRRIDPQTFDHAAETGWALQGRHAAIARNCEKCHKVRSFLEARAACSTCHADAHKGTLGTACTTCHATDLPFKETRTRFDHTRASFQLIGSHRTVPCQKCHVDGQFRGLQFDTCAACHQEPHKARFGPTCTNCHTPEQWATRTVEHGKTRFPLVGMHAQVACAKCHQTSIVKPIRFDTCSSCHVNVHRDSVKEDCRVCHTESGFRKAAFDHAARTGFPLVGKHGALECRTCHTKIQVADLPLARKVVDFGGNQPQCASCHKDQHNGDYGLRCDSCHRPTGFSVTGFTHPRSPEFYAGQHASVACVRCHGAAERLRPTQTPALAAQPRPSPLVAQVRYAPAANSPSPAAADLRPVLAAQLQLALATQTQQQTPSFECASCHRDVHLGQVGASCDRCHWVDGVKFTPVRFAHEATPFPLTGMHVPLACAKCHTTAVRAFPSGTGSAVQFHPMANDCGGCHRDQHLGQLDPQCDHCHRTTGFKMSTFPHPGLEQFFAGNHGRLPCAACHKQETGQFPAGTGTAVRFKVGRTCAACHPQF